MDQTKKLRRRYRNAGADYEGKEMKEKGQWPDPRERLGAAG